MINENKTKEILLFDNYVRGRVGPVQSIIVRIAY
jgi:hypothetical protein